MIDHIITGGTRKMGGDMSPWSWKVGAQDMGGVEEEEHRYTLPAGNFEPAVDGSHVSTIVMRLD